MYLALLQLEKETSQGFFYLQGYMSGASFAHSLVSHIHMQDIDQYLTTIDNMPETLKNIKVCP